jgi:repressor LexA|uniref:LexA repressor n=1 Tax=Thiomonas intermedia (strain K12) TaxID=75379 RepID=D5X0I5_THIK1
MRRLISKLTPRQQEILDLITASVRELGYPPTRAEIAAKLGFRSANAAEDHLQALARKGVIELTPGASRGIRITESQRASPSMTTLGKTSGAMGGRASGLRADLSHGLQLALPGAEQLCLPLVGRVAAGHPILAQEHIEQTLNVDPGAFSVRPDYLLKVRGMSMRDAGILDGDMLAVKSSQTAQSGQIVVARIGDEVTVKRLRLQADHIELLPANPEFAPIRVDASQPFAIEGLAVGLLRGSLQ